MSINRVISPFPIDIASTNFSCSMFGVTFYFAVCFLTQPEQTNKKIQRKKTFYLYHWLTKRRQLYTISRYISTSVKSNKNGGKSHKIEHRITQNTSWLTSALITHIFRPKTDRRHIDVKAFDLVVSRFFFFLFGISLLFYFFGVLYTVVVYIRCAWHMEREKCTIQRK